jgi:uncharacterized RDD family membrane protein YckC
LYYIVRIKQEAQVTTTPPLPGEPEDAREEAQQALENLYDKPQQDTLGQTAYAAVPPPLGAGSPYYATGSPYDQAGAGAGGPGYPPPPPPPGSYGPGYGSGPGYGPGPGYGNGQQMPGPAGMPGLPIGMPPFAGWWRRAGAWLLDNFLVGFALGLIVNWANSDVLEGVSGLIALVWAIYNGYLAGTTGQSYGKRAVGIRLARLTDGKPIGGGYGLLRLLMDFVFLWLCFIPGLLNLLWPSWDAKHQTWCDKMAGSVVVQA